MSSLCIFVAVVIGVYWCSTIYLNMITEKKRRYIITIYHTFVACAFIFSDLQKKKEDKKSLASEPMYYKNLFVPSAGSYDRSGTWLFFYVMIYLTEQCNRRTVHYSLVGKTKHAVCSWSVRDTRRRYGAVRLSHTALSVEVIAWLTALRGIWVWGPFSFGKTRFCIRTISSCHIWCALF